MKQIFKIKSIFKNLYLFLLNIDNTGNNKFSKLYIEELENGIDRKLIKPFTYRSRFGNIEVPKEFITDYASTPRLLWVFTPPATGKYKFAAVIHDWLYRTEMYNRSKCDKIFLEAMYDIGVNRTKAYIIYSGVVLCGWCIWNKHNYEFIKSYRLLSPKTKFNTNRFKKD